MILLYNVNNFQQIKDYIVNEFEDKDINAYVDINLAPLTVKELENKIIDILNITIITVEFKSSKNKCPKILNA